MQNLVGSDTWHQIKLVVKVLRIKLGHTNFFRMSQSDVLTNSKGKTLHDEINSFFSVLSNELYFLHIILFF